MNFKQIEFLPLNVKTAYLSGVIVGDGHISNSRKSKKDQSFDYNIVIELVDKKYLEYILEQIYSLTKTSTSIKERGLRGNRLKSYYIQVRNKNLYYFLTKDMGIPSGKKCYDVTVPNKIMEEILLQKCFLAGFFDTDGGRRGNSLGFTSASYDLIQKVSLILNNLNVAHRQEKWLNLKYKREYYGIVISRNAIDKFLNEVPFKNVDKLKRFYHVDVPEWSNGIDNFKVSPCLGQSGK